jgi:5-methylcytosine-specific restriction endonuclease McrA
MYLIRHCLECNEIIPKHKRQNKFCDSSCSATYNNRGIRRHGNPPSNCKRCGKQCGDSKRIYCSIECSAAFQRTVIDKVQRNRIVMREANARYRAKQKSQTPVDVDRKAIQEFYANCPVGYEVDHIIPISKGGLHDLSNLQYLTRSENRKKHNKVL